MRETTSLDTIASSGDIYLKPDWIQRDNSSTALYPVSLSWVRLHRMYICTKLGLQALNLHSGQRSWRGSAFSKWDFCL